MKKMKVLTEQEVIKLLSEGRGELTKKRYAEEIGVSAQYLGDVLHGRRSPGPAILEYLHLEKMYCPYWDKET